MENDSSNFFSRGARSLLNMVSGSQTEQPSELPGATQTHARPQPPNPIDNFQYALNRLQAALPDDHPLHSASVPKTFVAYSQLEQSADKWHQQLEIESLSGNASPIPVGLQKSAVKTLLECWQDKIAFSDILDPRKSDQSYDFLVEASQENLERVRPPTDASEQTVKLFQATESAIGARKTFREKAMEFIDHRDAARPYSSPGLGHG